MTRLKWVRLVARATARKNGRQRRLFINVCLIRTYLFRIRRLTPRKRSNLRIAIATLLNKTTNKVALGSMRLNTLQINPSTINRLIQRALKKRLFTITNIIPHLLNNLARLNDISKLVRSNLNRHQILLRVNERLIIRRLNRRNTSNNITRFHLNLTFGLNVLRLRTSRYRSTLTSIITLRTRTIILR